MHKVTCTSARVKVMTTSHYILPGNAPWFKERLMMRIGVYMYRVKLVLLSACI